MLIDKHNKEIIKMMESVEAEPRYILNEGLGMDYMVIFALAQKFAVPFKKTKAYRLGIIDEKGNIIKPPKTSSEKNAFTPLDNLVTRIKKLIPKNLLYLLTFAYIFKGFATKKTYKSLYEGTETESELLEAEEKHLALIRARAEITETIQSNPRFTEEEYWSFIAEQID